MEIEMKKIIDFIKSKKETLVKFGVLALIVAGVTGLTLLILYLANVITFDGGLNFNIELFEQFKNTWYGAVLIVVLQTVLTMVLCFVPAISMAFIVLISTLYPDPLTAFALSFASVMLSSAILYILGRFGGYKLCVKLLGKEDCDKSLDLLRNNGTVYFPLMMMFPIFPDDALVMIAGTIKMKLAWFVPSIVIGRGIGIFTIVYGLDIIPFDQFTGIYDWFLLITACAFWLIIIFYLAGKLNKKLSDKRKAEESASAEKEAENA